MSKLHFACCAVVCSAVFAASPATADLITNGDFETAGAGGARTTFAGWTESTTSVNSAGDQTLSVISGSHSAEIFRGDTGTASITQVPSTLLSDVNVDLDFAILSTVGANRSALFDFSFTSGGLMPFIHMKLQSGKLSMYTTAGWSADLALPAAATTVDTGAQKVWNGETPVVNHLRVALRTGVGDGAPHYDVTLNGSTVTSLVAFVGSTVAAGATFSNIMMSGTSDTSWLVDNITVASSTVPEPSTVVVLASGLLSLLAYAWRGRK